MPHPSKLPSAAGDIRLQKEPIAFGEQWVFRGKHDTKITGYIIGLIIALLLLIGAAHTYNLNQQIGDPLFIPTHNSDGESTFEGLGIPILIMSVIGFGLLLVDTFKLVITLQRRRLGTPMLLLSQDHYSSGDHLYAEFVREVQKGRTISARPLEIKIECIEMTRTGSGTDISYPREVLWHQEVRIPQAPQSTRLIGSAHFDLPPHLPENVSEESHWVFWKMTVEQDCAGLLNEVSEFYLPVDKREMEQMKAVPASTGRHAPR